MYIRYYLYSVYVYRKSLFSETACHISSSSSVDTTLYYIIINDIRRPSRRDIRKFYLNNNNKKKHVKNVQLCYIL